jgi:phosphatidylglycerophosphate synthase
VFYSLSSFLVWTAARLGITPNQLTVSSFSLNITAGIYFLTAKMTSRSVLLTLSVFTIAHVLDCADGQLATATNQRTERGYWLDSALDIFKIAFVTSCFCKLMMLGGVDTASRVPEWQGKIALCALMGIVTNYAVYLHASKYKPSLDGYRPEQQQLSALYSLKNSIARFFLSHVREYANVLIVFGLFAVNTQLAVSAFALLGTAHLMLALHRVYRISRLLES